MPAALKEQTSQGKGSGNQWINLMETSKCPRRRSPTGHTRIVLVSTLVFPLSAIVVNGEGETFQSALPLVNPYISTLAQSWAAIPRFFNWPVVARVATAEVHKRFELLLVKNVPSSPGVGLLSRLAWGPPALHHKRGIHLLTLLSWR
eukprot:537791-Amphidinium_carterae.1